MSEPTVADPVAQRARAPEVGARLSLRSLQLGLNVVRLGPVLILAVLVAVLGVLSPVFLSERNIQNVVTQTSTIAILALGQMLVIVTRGVDVSVGSILGLATVMGALVYGTSADQGVVVVLAMLATGAAIGAVNGAVFVYGRLPNALINTLAMYSIARGVALVITHGDAKPGMPPIVTSIGSGFIGAIPDAALLLVALAGIFLLLTRATKWGRWIYAVGGNPEAAKRVGIPVNKVLVSVYVISGLCAGCAGIVVAGQTDAGFPQAGMLAELDAIAAVIIGGTSFLGGRGTVTGALVGAFIIGCIRNGLNLLDVDPTWQMVAVGSIILVAVELDVLRNHLEARFRVSQAVRSASRGEVA
jgi:ribose transport system permease protein